MSVKYANRLLAVVVALALIALAVVVTGEILRAVLGQSPWLVPYQDWRTSLASTAWSNVLVRVALFLMALAGLLIVLAELKPRRIGVVPLTSTTPGISAGTNRRSLQTALERAAGEVPGIAGAKAKVSRRHVGVTARSRLQDRTGLADQVYQRVQERVDGLALAARPKVKVKVEGGSR